MKQTVKLGLKKSILGIDVSITDYYHATKMICDSAEAMQGIAVSALAIHGIMLGFYNLSWGKKLNELDIATPDGQGVRWALNIIHKSGLKDRVYGPKLMQNVIEEAARRKLSIYLYGSTQNVIDKLSKALLDKTPGLLIAGMRCSKFRPLTHEEIQDDLTDIRNSGAKIVFVGLGCPRQEAWVLENRKHLSAALIAIGAAFDFLSGNKPQAPGWVQKYGLEMVFRVITEPRRLWKRFILCQPPFVFLITLQWIASIICNFYRSCIKVSYNYNRDKK